MFGGHLLILAYAMSQTQCLQGTESSFAFGDCARVTYPVACSGVVDCLFSILHCFPIVTRRKMNDNLFWQKNGNPNIYMVMYRAEENIKNALSHWCVNKNSVKNISKAAKKAT